nr:integrase, catalytic region, zinc finger, CCHC-type, peptidase aspartic, catalytic [Tanacetum cinerariifolium]
MSTQQDIYAAGSKSRPPMLNKENYVPWSSRLLRYAKSIPNGKLIHNSIINGPYTDEEFTEKELKQIEADDQAIQTILLGLPEDIYAAVDSCETAQEIWLRVYQMMKGSDIGIQRRRPSCSMNRKADYTQLYDFLKYNQKEADELKAKRLAKTQDPLALMATSNNPYNFPVLNQDQPSFNQNYMQQPMPNPKDITDHTTTMNMALTLMQNAQPGMNMGQDRQMQMVGGNGENQFRQYARQNVGNLNGYNAVQNVMNQNLNGNGNLVVARAEGNATGHNGNQIRCYNCRGVGHFARNCMVRPRRRDAAYLQTQLLIAQKEKAGIQLQAEEFDLMAAATDLDEIEEVNENCILIASLQQASTSGTQTDKALVYDSGGSAEVHDYENCIDNEIFNMFTQEEQYTELLEPILEPHQVPQNDHNVIFENLAIEAEKVNTVNRKLKETNVDLTTELVRFKNKEKCFEISQEKYDKLERCYQQSVYQEQCIFKKINALHLSLEKKKLKSDFKIREDKLLDKQIQLEKKIKELNNLLVKTGQSIQTINMLSPNPYSFYHTEQKIALGYQNPFYLKQAQKKQQSLYDGKVLLEKHDPPVVHDSEETLQLAQERMFRINPFKTSREEKHVPNNVSASARTKPITISQHSVITKKDVNSDSNGLSSTGIDNTKTRRPQPRSNTKNDRVPSASKSSRSKNKGVEQQGNQAHLQSETVADNVPVAMFDENTFVNLLQIHPQDHPLEQVIGEPSRLVLTRNQLRSDGDMCMYALTVSTMEPKNVKEAMADPAWIESMQAVIRNKSRL